MHSILTENLKWIKNMSLESIKRKYFLYTWIIHLYLKRGHNLKALKSCGLWDKGNYQKFPSGGAWAAGHFIIYVKIVDPWSTGPTHGYGRENFYKPTLRGLFWVFSGQHWLEISETHQDLPRLRKAVQLRREGGIHIIGAVPTLSRVMFILFVFVWQNRRDNQQRPSR